MTDTTMELSDFLPRDDHEDCLHGIVEAVLRLFTKTEVEGIVGAGRLERSGYRTQLGSNPLG